MNFARAMIASVKLVVTLVVTLMPGAVRAAPVAIVAAENFYGDVARQIGGADVSIISILNSPSQDPHLFEITPSVARAVSEARIVIANGAGYDPWMDSLLRAARSPARLSIVVATLVGGKPGDNPHIWYDPTTMLTLARALTEALCTIDPAHAAGYARRQQDFVNAMQPVQAAIAALRGARQGTEVTATEPVFAYLFAALGMRMRNGAFQVAVMNNTEPAASGVAAFETSLRAHDVKLLVYNSQAMDPVADRMRRIAREAGIPVIAVTETEPADTTYQQWMLDAIHAIGHALDTAS